MDDILKGIITKLKEWDIPDSDIVTIDSLQITMGELREIVRRLEAYEQEF